MLYVEMTIHVDFLVGWTDLTNTLHTNDRKYLKQNTRINFDSINWVPLLHDCEWTMQNEEDDANTGKWSLSEKLS